MCHHQSSIRITYRVRWYLSLKSSFNAHSPANTTHCADAVSTLSHHLRCWPIIITTSAQCLVFLGLCWFTKPTMALMQWHKGGPTMSLLPSRHQSPAIDNKGKFVCFPTWLSRIPSSSLYLEKRVTETQVPRIIFRKAALFNFHLYRLLFDYNLESKRSQNMY